MASISAGGGNSTKKSVDHEIPLIPFIDLLLCCIMFLLVTAVWNKLSSVEANLDAPGTPESEMVEPVTEPLLVRVEIDGYRVSDGLGAEWEVPINEVGDYDAAALHAHLAHRRQLNPNQNRVVVAGDDDVEYAHLIGAIDVIAASGFGSVTVTGR